MRYIFPALLATLLFFIPTGILSESTLTMNIGRAPFAIQHPTFECNKFLRSLEQLPDIHISYLYNTFGRSNRCLNRVLETGKVRTLQVHLINEPCHRNGQCGPYEFLSSIRNPQEYDRLLRRNNRALKRRYQRYITPKMQFLQALPSEIEILISPGLESNVSAQAFQTLVFWTKELAPEHARIVWNPFPLGNKRAQQVGADLIEGHGKRPTIQAPCIANLDGVTIEFPQSPIPAKDQYGRPVARIRAGRELQNWITRYSNRCEVVFLWTLEDNCRRIGSFVDPRKRQCNSGQTHNRVANQILIAQRRLFP